VQQRVVERPVARGAWWRQRLALDPECGLQPGDRLADVAVGQAGVDAERLRVGAAAVARILFRLAPSRTPNEVWDLGYLIKPTLDAMEGVFGLRAWNGKPQAADDRGDLIEHSSGERVEAKQQEQRSTCGSSIRTDRDGPWQLCSRRTSQARTHIVCIADNR
jgi:hypothetical protein